MIPFLVFQSKETHLEQHHKNKKKNNKKKTGWRGEENAGAIPPHPPLYCKPNPQSCCAVPSVYGKLLKRE
jgi:hypothetical protein